MPCPSLKERYPISTLRALALRRNFSTISPLLCLLVYVLCTTSYQIGSGAAAPTPRQPTRPIRYDHYYCALLRSLVSGVSPGTAVSTTGLGTEWMPQFWHSFTKVIYFPECQIHVNQEDSSEKSDTTQRQMGQGRYDQKPVLGGMSRNHHGSKASKERSANVSVQMSALSKMLNSVRLEVTDAQLEQPQHRGDIDQGIPFGVPEIPFVYHN